MKQYSWASPTHLLHSRVLNSFHFDKSKFHSLKRHSFSFIFHLISSNSKIISNSFFLARMYVRFPSEIGVLLRKTDVEKPHSSAFLLERSPPGLFLPSARGLGFAHDFYDITKWPVSWALRPIRLARPLCSPASCSLGSPKGASGSRGCHSATSLRLTAIALRNCLTIELRSIVWLGNSFGGYPHWSLWLAQRWPNDLAAPNHLARPPLR